MSTQDSSSGCTSRPKGLATSATKPLRVVSARLRAWQEKYDAEVAVREAFQWRLQDKTAAEAEAHAEAEFARLRAQAADAEKHGVIGD